MTVYELKRAIAKLNGNAKVLVMGVEPVIQITSKDGIAVVNLEDAQSVAASA